MSFNENISSTGALAQAIADEAVRTIGPSGTVIRVPEEDASLVRSMFIARLAEAATKLANGEPML